MLATLRQDLAYALRAIARAPGFAAAVVATLALGIGANSTMFSVLDVLLVRPPAGVRASDEVVRLYVRQTHVRFGEWTNSSTSVPDFEAVRDGTPLLTTTVAQFVTTMSLGRGAEARPIRAASVSHDYFDMLGVVPARGRFFTADEDRVGGERVAVLSEAYWRTRFAGDTAILGRALPIGRSTYTVIGVSPAGFTGVDLRPADLWLPLGASSDDVSSAEAMSSRDFYWIEVLARVRPGADRHAAAEQATLAYRNAREAARPAAAVGERRVVISGGGGGASDEGPATVLFGPVQESRGPTMSDDAKVALWVGIVAGIVLLVACANVANLLLARGVSRRREIAVRLGLGATRVRLLGLFLVESVMLGLLGGVAALLRAVWGGAAMRAFLLPDLPADAAFLDWRVLAFTGGIAVVAGVLAGIAPAFRSSRLDLSQSLKDGGRGQTASRGRLRAGLVVAQVALTVVLLVGAGLFVRSLRDAQGVNLGFDPDRVVMISVDLGEIGLDQAAQEATYRRLFERVRAYPGVERAALSMGLPFWSTFATEVRVHGVDSLPVGREGGPYHIMATPEYFETAGLRLLSGRIFTDADGPGSAKVAVINEAFARRVFAGRDPVGEYLYIGGDSVQARIVGVVENAANGSVTDLDVLLYYLPLDQRAMTPSITGMLLRTRGPAAPMVPGIQRALQESESGIPWVRARSLAEHLAPQYRSWRLGATMFTAFGCLALVIAGLGLYGVTAYSVGQRTQEIGVRVALGAQAETVVRLMMRQGLLSTVAGLVLGGGGAWLLGRAVRSLLFGVGPADPLVYGVVASVLLAVAAAAAWLPARRAATVDPMVALRAE
jgi:predicted permease